MGSRRQTIWNCSSSVEQCVRYRYSVVPLSRHSYPVDVGIRLLLLVALTLLVLNSIPLIAELVGGTSGKSYWKVEFELMFEDVALGYMSVFVMGLTMLDWRFERYIPLKSKRREFYREIEMARSQVVAISGTSRFGTAIALACISIGFPIFVWVPLLYEFSVRSLFDDVDAWFRSWSGPKPLTVNNTRVAVGALWGLMTASLMCGHRINIRERFGHYLPRRAPNGGDRVSNGSTGRGSVP